MSGKIVHFEIPYDDADRARTFYRAAFNWNIQELPDMGYNIVVTGPTTEAGMPKEPGYVNGGMLSRADAPSGSPVVTVDVESIDAALAKIGELGGLTVVGRTPVGDMGFAAYFQDPEGNLMGLWENAPQG